MTVPDPFAEEALTHIDALYNHARRLSHNPADADELVQETYTRVLAGARTFTGGNLKAWMFKILRNAFIDAHRRRKNQPSPGDLHLVEGAVDGGLLTDAAEAERLQGLTSAEIEAALAALSDDARAIVLLDIEGFTEAEVAEVIGCPLGTVKSRLSRARALLRVRLKDYAPAGPRRGVTPSSGDR